MYDIYIYIHHITHLALIAINNNNSRNKGGDNENGNCNGNNNCHNNDVSAINNSKFKLGGVKV